MDQHQLTSPSTDTCEVRIYWDTQDPQDCGPAWRSDHDSGPLDFVGWSDGSDGEGRHLTKYFGSDGFYLGPDAEGIYPVLR